MWIGVVWTGLQVAMWIAHLGGKYRHGLLDKSLIIVFLARLKPYSPEAVFGPFPTNSQKVARRAHYLPFLMLAWDTPKRGTARRGMPRCCRYVS